MTNQILGGDALVKVIVDALKDVQTTDIQCIDMREKLGLTDYMVIATGTSNRQVSAMAEVVRKALEEKGVKKLTETGAGDSDWFMLDFNSVVVHLMTAAARQFYDFERLVVAIEQGRA